MIAPLLLLLSLQVPATGITGTVKSEVDQLPLEGVSVILRQTGVEAITDASGLYVLRGVPEGWHQIQFTRLGYRDREIGFRVGGTVPSGLDVSLVVEPVLLEPIDVDGSTSTRGASRARSDVLDDLGAYRATVADLREDPLTLSMDVIEALSALPETQGVPGSIGAFHVRGGSADENLVLLDGTPILNPYHALGLASSIIPDVVGEMDFHSGVPPAQFGGRLSSVLDLRSRPADPLERHVSGGLENYSARVGFDGPLPSGLGSMVLAGRHSYEGPAAGRAEEDISWADFHDWYAKISIPVGGGVLEAMGLSASDRLGFRAQPPTDGARSPPKPVPGIDPLNQFSWASDSKSVRWRREGPKSLEAHAYRSAADASALWDPDGARLDMRNRVTSSGLRLIVEQRRPGREILAGASMEQQRVTYALDGQDQTATASSTYWQTLSIFAHARQRWGPAGISAGLRLTGVDDLNLGIEPRVTIATRFGDHVTLGIGYARMRQEVQSLRNEESLSGLAAGIDLLGAAATQLGRAATSDQLMASLEARIGSRLTAHADVYYRWLDNLLLVAPETAEPFGSTSYTTGSGTASGFTLSLAGRVRRGTARVSYAVGDVRRAAAGLDYAPGFHRHHLLRAGSGVDLTDKLSLQLRLETGSGAATSTQIGELDFEPLDPILGEGNLSGTPRRIARPLNDSVSPSYLRIDGGLRYVLREEGPHRRGRLSGFALVTNMLNRENVVAFAQNPEGGLTAIPFGRIGVRAGIEWRY